MLCFTQPTRHKILEPSVEIAYCTEAHSPLGSSDGITSTERILHAHRHRASHRSPCIDIIGESLQGRRSINGRSKNVLCPWVDHQPVSRSFCPDRVRIRLGQLRYDRRRPEENAKGRFANVWAEGQPSAANACLSPSRD